MRWKGLDRSSSRPWYWKTSLAQRLARGVAQQAFGEIHQALVVRVGLVEFHHREFRVVARREAFVAEIAVDLEDLLEPADNQAFQIQLGGDAQELLHVERIVVRDERLGRSAAGDRVHHRRFDFEEAVPVHVIADRGDDAAAGEEGEAGFLVHDQVDVTLAILHFLIGQTVELVWQWAQRLGQQADFSGLDSQFTGLGLHQGTDDTKDVAEIPGLEVGIDFFAESVAGDVDLDAARQIL